MAYSETRSIIEDLEEQVEYWRNRCEAAESVLRDDGWNRTVRPMTLQQTRIMRLLAKRDLTPAAITTLLEDDYPTITSRAVMTRLSQIRTILPENLCPASCIGRHGTPYCVPDKEALSAFLRRAA